MAKILGKFLSLRMLPFGTALLFYLCFYPVNLGFLAFLALVPFFCYVYLEQSHWRLVLFSWLAGGVFYLISTFWLRHVTWYGLFAASFLMLGWYFALFALLFRLIFFGREKWLRIAGLAATWLAVEYLSGLFFSGFPWFLAGYSQYYFKWLIQISDLSGVYGVSLIVVLVNAVITEIILHKKLASPDSPYRPVFPALKEGFARNKYLVLAVLALLLASAAYGAARLATLEFSKGPKLGLVQGNVPQEVKEFNLPREEAEKHCRKYFDSHKALSLKLLPQKPDLVVWAETAFMYVVGDGEFEKNKNLLKGLGGLLKTPVLIGAPAAEKKKGGEEEYYNSAFYYDPASKALDRYDKINLVMVSEYIPLKDSLPFLKDFILKFTELKQLYGLTPGKEQKIFELRYGKDRAAKKFGVLICFESIFPDLSRGLVDRGADFIVTISNDGWFKDSCELEQISRITAFRAIENRIGIARATNTGISAFFSPDGSFSPLSKGGRTKEIEGILCDYVSLKASSTVYSAVGDVLPVFCLLLAGVFLLKKALYWCFNLARR